MPRDEGFTLVEMLVALVLVGLAAAIVASAVASGRTASVAARQVEQAVAVARSRLAETGFVRPLVPGVERGTDETGSRWSIDVREHGPALSGEQIYAVRVEVSGDGSGAGRAVELFGFRHAQRPGQ